MSRTIDDIDLEVELAEGRKKAKTANSYKYWTDKFVKFCKGEEDQKEYYTDHNVAAWLVALGLEYNHKPYAKKSAVAAINDKLGYYCLPNICDFKHEWPHTTVALQVSAR